MDSRIIEAAYSASEEEVTISLSDMGRMYTIDFTMMQQINEDTGTARPVFRTTNSNLATAAAASADSSDLVKPDARAEVLAEQPELASSFIKSLFGILYEVYSSSAGPAIRHKCLQTLLRQIYYASPELLQEVLVNQPVSSHIASMLASQDHKVVVGALQMADILMRRLPETFTQYFQRQGVTHQIRNLSSSGVVASHCEGAATSNNSQPTAAPPDQTSGAVRPTDAASSRTVTSVISSVISSAISSAATTSGAPSASGASNPLPAGALTTGTSKSETGAIAKSKKTSKRIATRHSKSKSSLKKSESSTAGSNSGAASTSNLTKLSKASFLATFNPTRWGKNTPSDKPPLADSRSVSTATLLANYREKVKSWITTHAKEFMNEHFSKLNPTAVKAEGVLLTLSKAANLLTGKDTKRSVEGDREALEMVAYTVADDDVSPFEMIHSGVIDTLTTYLHASPQVPSTSTALNDLSLPLEKRLAIFMNVFIGCPISPSTTYSQVAVSNEHRFAQLVSKTMACLHQQEQFQVKVHDLGLASGGGSANSNAMKFLSSHQLKCQLQRHPECKTFRAYSGGPVKVDPLAPVHAIENFLIRHGYCKPEGAAVSADIEIISDDEDGNSVDDLDDSMPGMLVDQRLGKHTIELVIGDRPLSYNQTVLQAIRNHATIDDSDHALGGSSVWSQTHVIWYRQATSEKSTGSAVSHSAPKKTKADGTNKSRKVKKTQDFFTDGVVSLRTCPLITSLSQTMAGRISVQDSCMQSVSLIRILYYINKYWGSLYQVLSYQPPVAESTFISSKLTAKANRQLQDPLVIMTGNIPQWLPQLAGSCPFLFPFETRHLLFYVNTFDRDRAMMRLQEANVDVSDMDTSGRVGPPRLEKRKKVVSRENIIKQAEHIFEDATDLDIWHSPRNSESQADSTEYVDCKYGLYPKPLGRSAKLATVSKIKAKFRFIGKLLAKALMDSRILDLPMNPIIYSWLLGQQAVLTPSDLSSYDPSIAASYSHLQEMSAKVRTIQSDTNLKEEEKEKALLEVGVEDLCLTSLYQVTAISG
ncbi:TRIP12 [Bugula neritina]|uniref:E3 ubiquitin-protein ligase n=1 Tax=Bugula neritina TaxID=10212 RepID=A0A7J7K7T1_BUGNE|nr:TRIP12 [Bugula neritina]